MALPTLDKTWQVSSTIINGGNYTNCNSQAFFNAKQSMKNFGSSPWTVWGSSNGAGAFGNNDGVDRWAAYTNVVFSTAGNNHGWIVLKQTGLGTNAAICFDALCFGGLAYYASIVLFPTGAMTNGSAVARPSATNEIGYPTPVSNLGFTDSAWAAGYSHVLQSTDGQCTRIVTCRSGYAVGYWAFEVPKNPVSGWTLPQVAMLNGSNGNANMPVYGQYNDSPSATFTLVGSVACPMYLASEGMGTQTIGEQYTYPDDDTGEYSMSPIDLVCATAGGRGAKKGRLYDAWWGSTTPLTGDTYPADGSRQFAQFGNLIFPWDGSVPRIA